MDLYLLTGAIGGILVGLIGGGIGPIVVPILLLSLPTIGISSDLSVHMAIGTSLAVVCITTLASVLVHYQNGTINQPLVYSLLPGSIFGGVFGSIISIKFPANLLQSILGYFLIYLAIKFIFLRDKNNKFPKDFKIHDGYINKIINVPTGFAIISSLFGICESLLLVPYLRERSEYLNTTVATSSVCSLVVSIFGAIPFLFIGFLDDVVLPNHSIGYVYLPALFAISITSLLFAPIGAYFSKYISEKITKSIFILTTVMIGIRLIS